MRKIDIICVKNINKWINIKSQYFWNSKKIFSRKQIDSEIL